MHCGTGCLDRLEDRALWFGPGPALRSVAQLADALRTDADFVSVGGALRQGRRCH